MTIRVWEKPKSRSTVVDFKQPSAKRMYGAAGSSDKTDILLAIIAFMPAGDTTIDPSTGGVITLFANKIDCDEVSGGSGSVGIWDIVVYYEATTATIDVAFNFGVESTKIFTALEDIRSYNCRSPASSGTNTAADAALDAAAAAVAAADAVIALESAATSAALDATVAANVSGVDATVKTKTLLAATKTTAVISDADTAAVQTKACATQTDSAAQSAYAGDTASATAAATLADAAATAAAAAGSAAGTDQTDAATAASDATAAIPVIDVGGVSAAAAAAATAAADAAAALSVAANAAATAAAAAAAAANAAATAAGDDTVIGANSVPNQNKMIGVNGGEVEGVEIEVGKVEICVTKKWSAAALSASYLKLLADYTERSCTNDATFTITWLGQSLIFPRDTLRFRCAPVKSDSGGQLEINYNFAYQRSITRADNFRIGNSAPITKTGWEYLWIYSKPGVSNSSPVVNPQYAYVQRVYPRMPFGALNL